MGLLLGMRNLVSIYNPAPHATLQTSADLNVWDRENKNESQQQQELNASVARVYSEDLICIRKEAQKSTFNKV